jgi:hypothetical protein
MTNVADNAKIISGLENAKSSQTLVELPCGYLDAEGVYKDVELREMTGNEEDLLASSAIPHHKKISALLSRCITRIGPYTDKGKIASIVQDLLLGDRIFLLFAVRRLTLGDEYPFRARCDSCNKEGSYLVDLSDLTIQEMPDPSKRIFDVELPSGIVVRFRCLTGRDEEESNKRPDNENRASVQIFTRVELINGQVPSMASIKNLSSRDRDFLRAKMEEVDGGVDTALELQCQFCNAEWSEDIEIGQPGFFFPSRVKKKLKLKSSI